MPYGNMFSRPQVPMNRPMTPMNRVSSAPASTPGISALLAGKPAQQPMQQQIQQQMQMQQPVRQDVSSMGLGSLPQAAQAGMPAFASSYQQQQAQRALDNVMSGVQQGQPIPDWAKNYIAQPRQAAPQLGGPIAGIAAPTEPYNPSLGNLMVPNYGPENGFPINSSINSTTQQDMMGGNGQAQQNQLGMLANLNQMFNGLSQQPPAQGGTPLQNGSSPLQQSAQQSVANPGVM